MALSERLFAAGLEQLSGSVVQIRADAKDRLDHLEMRLINTEKAARFNTDAMDHALAKIESFVNRRAIDQVENQRRAEQVEHRCNGLEDTLARLEMNLPDAGFGRRLDTIEKALIASAERLKQSDPAALFGASLQALSHRLEGLENNHKELLEVLRARPLAPSEPVITAPPAAAPMPVAAAPLPVAEAPPLVEPPDLRNDILPDTSDDPVEYSTTFTPDFEEVFIQPDNGPDEMPENFLTQARRAAAARAVPEEKAKPRYLFPALVGLLVVLALAAGLALSWRMKEQTVSVAANPAANPATSPAMRTFSLPEPPDSNSDDTEFVVAPQAGQPADPSAANAPPRTALPLQPRAVRNAPVNPVPDGAAAERVIQMANAGNPAALTILGLRAVDGPTVNLADAVKFLTQAAEKGQPVAQYRLGTLYERGQGVPADAVKAAHWYELAANQGNRKAMHNLAVFNAGGAAGKKNMAEAARWFARAAALGLSDSQFNLAVLYERGDGVPQSLVDAYKWYAIAAAAGDSESKSRIAVLQSQLGDADKAAAGKSVLTFHAAPLNHAANVPPDAASLGS